MRIVQRQALMGMKTRKGKMIGMMYHIAGGISQTAMMKKNERHLNMTELDISESLLDKSVEDPTGGFPLKDMSGVMTHKTTC